MYLLLVDLAQNLAQREQLKRLECEENDVAVIWLRSQRRVLTAEKFHEQ